MKQQASIGRAAVRAASWLVLARIAIRLIGLLSTVILARLLVPADFGLVAMAAVVAAGLEAVTEFSFGLVLITDREVTRERYDTAWTLNVARGLVVAAALLLASPYLTAFFGDPRLQAIIPWFALAIAVAGFRNIGMVQYERELIMSREFALTVSTKIIGFLITVGLAVTLRNYWALVAGIVAARLSQTAISFLVHPFRPRLSLAQWRDIFSFSKWVLGGNVVRFAYNRADYFVIGRIADAATLGVYTIAREIATLATSELSAPVRRALLPGFSMISADADSLRRSFLRTLSVILLVGLPIAAGPGAIAAPLVDVALGAKWTATAPLIEVFALYSCLTLLIANTGPCLMALRLPHLSTLVNGGFLGLTIPLTIWWAYQFGAIGAAWAVTVCSALMAVVMLAITLRTLALGALPLLQETWRSIVAGVLMAAAAHAASQVESGFGSAAQLALGIAVGAVVYTGTHLLLWWLCGRPDGAERAVLDYLGRRGLTP